MRFLFQSIVFILIIGSCEVPRLDLSEISFININEMELKTNFDQGSNNHNFKDAWVFENGKSIGVYEIPRRVAIANEDPGREIPISIRAGIRENGVNSSLLFYPFIDVFNQNISLAANEEITIVPTFEYLPETKFRLIGDFENSNLFTFDEDKDTLTKIEITSDDFASGGKSGKIHLQAGQLLQQASTLVYNDIPLDGRPVYVEIDFKGNLDLDVGLIGIGGGQLFKDYFVSLRSENVWKKVYINLTELIVASNLEGYQLLLGADNSLNNSEAIIYVDNIKLLHF